MSLVILAYLALLSTASLRTTAQQLDCNFDLSTLCNWSNGVNGLEDDFDWQIGNSVAVDGFHSIPRSITGTGNFAYAQGKLRPTETDTAKAWMRSPTIDGLSRQATLSFSYWKTAAPPVLQVCTRDAGVSQLRCLDTISGLGNQQWTRREVTIPPNPLPFQIIFVATNFRTTLDLVGLDDVQFRTTSANMTFLDDVDTLQLQKVEMDVLASTLASGLIHRQNDDTHRSVPNVTTHSHYSADALDELRIRSIGQQLGREQTDTSSIVQRQRATQAQNPAKYQSPSPAPNLGQSDEIDPQNIRIHKATTETSTGLQQNRRLLQLQQQRQQELLQQQQLQEQLRQQRLLEFRQNQQLQLLQKAQQTQQLLQQRPPIFQPTSSAFSLTPDQTGQGLVQGISRNFQVVDPTGLQSLPLLIPTVFVPQPFSAQGPRPDVIVPPPEGAFFGPPLPAVTGPPQSLPVERSEPDIDAARSTQVISVFIQRTTPATVGKFTLPANWFRAVGKNEVENSLRSPAGQVAAAQPQETTQAANTHDHTRNHVDEQHHHHGGGEFAFGVCQAVTCLFDANLCNWFNDLSANFDWKLKNNQSQYQGIPQDFTNRPSYLFVSGDQRRPDERAVIKSQPFVAPSGAYLEFFSFVSDPTVTRLSAYRNIGNEQPNVLWQTLGNGQVEKNSWQRVRVPLPASSFPMTISVVSDQLSTGQYIGVDDLRLVDSGGSDVGCAADTTFTSLGPTRRLLLTPFPPKEPGEDGLRQDLQLSPLKAAALLNNPGQEAQFVSQQSFSATTPIPGSQSTDKIQLLLLNPSSNQKINNDSSSNRVPAIVQQRRIGVIEAQGSLGNEAADTESQQQQQLPFNSSLSLPHQTSDTASGVQISSIDKNGQRKGLLRSFERQSQQYNVFQPARANELPIEIIYATQISPSQSSLEPTSTQAWTAPLGSQATDAPSFTTGSGHVLRSVDPVFPPGDSPEINDQDAFYKRRGLGSGISPRHAPQKGPVLRTESNDALASVIGTDGDDLVSNSEEYKTTVTYSQSVSTSQATTANPDPLGFSDFVSSLTRDLQALAGATTGGTSWQQSGASSNKFRSANSLSYSPLGVTALGLPSEIQPQPSNNGGWLQSIFGKRK